MKRRINLGCALMHRPKLILLDEPAVGIDPQARINLLEFIRDLVKEGVGVLYTTHYLDEAESLCDRIGIIDHGKVLAEGTLEELRKRIGHDQLFVLEGNFEKADPKDWPDFLESFRLNKQSEKQVVVATIGECDPAECLKQLLELSIRLDNVMLKRPSLNDGSLQLTGRELRD